MTFSLTVDSVKFRGHLVSVMNSYAAAGAELVPVVKGNVTVLAGAYWHKRLHAWAVIALQLARFGS